MLRIRFNLPLLRVSSLFEYSRSVVEGPACCANERNAAAKDCERDPAAAGGAAVGPPLPAGDAIDAPNGDAEGITAVCAPPGPGPGMV